jgi:hypothetical protein
MTFPSFGAGEVLTAADMNAVGMWLVKTQVVGAGVSSVTVTGAFSSDYDNYRIVVSGGSMSVGTNFGLKLGTTATAGYFGTLIYTASFPGAPAVQAVGDNNAAQFTFGGGGGTDNVGGVIDLMSPNLAKTTRVAVTGIHYSTVCGTYNGVDTSSTQHTSFVLTPFAGATFTGCTIRVYGYRN